MKKTKEELLADLELSKSECKKQLLEAGLHPEESALSNEHMRNAINSLTQIRILEMLLNVDKSQAFDPYQYV